MGISNILNEHQRLSILHCLAAMDGYRANNSIIQTVCGQYGNNMTNDRLLTHLNWLEEQGLVKVESHDTYTVAVITERGLDIETGRASAPGVKRPGPK